MLAADGYLLGTPRQPRLHVRRPQALLRPDLLPLPGGDPGPPRSGSTSTAATTSPAPSRAVETRHHRPRLAPGGRPGDESPETRARPAHRPAGSTGATLAAKA
ncbi:hypothetical protein LT493_02565 [Streptomyces tricolor]|nr:hypothetical protein [Streptomyces tricolor]